MNILRKIIKNKLEITVLAIVIVLALLAHGYNMFHFPPYFDDEGTYMSQAWSILNLGKLAPYTYWYDHAPLGSLLIAVWIKITGGFFTFGNSIDSGRVFMLLIQLLNVALIYKIATKLSNKIAAFISIILFSFSPLSITLHRLIFLDNIMVFWLLLSLYTLLVKPLKISMVALSAFSLGLAALTKESAFFFIPPLFITLLAQSSHKNRHFILVKWVAIFGGVIIFYCLYALLKGELLPDSILNSSKHVSLIETFMWQLSRKGGFFLDKSSEFYYTFMQSWLNTDPILVIGGIGASLMNLIIGIKRKSFFIVSIFSLSYFIYLIRGGIVNDQYLIPVLPLVSLNMGLLISEVVSMFKGRLSILRYASLFLIVIILIVFYSKNLGLYSLNYTKNQIETLLWLKSNAQEKISVGDGYGLVDMWYGNTDNIYEYKGYQHYWKVEDDPQLREELLLNDWKNIDYLIITPRMQRDFQINTFPMLKTFLSHADLVKTINVEGNQEIKNKNVLISLSGPINIYKKQNISKILLDSAWAYYKSAFIKSYGQSVDPSREYKTTSEGQSYAMLKAVFQNDKPTFDGIWSWTKDHLRYRNQDKLISWLWGEKDGKEQLIDSNNATDADEDIALSLILASNKWNNPKYLDEAKVLLNDIWENAVVRVNGKYYILPAVNGFDKPDGYVLNLSYFSPASYRVFSTVDKIHPWGKLADDSYSTLEELSKIKNNKTDLPPNWIFVTNDGELISAKKYMGKDSDNYGFDAFRTLWRVSLDYKWFGEKKAEKYLKDIDPFFSSQIKDNKKIYSMYSLDGKPIVNYTSLSTNVGPLSVFAVSNSKKAEELYNSSIYKKFNFEQGYWGDKNNYFDQNWAWFGTALYTNSLNLPQGILDLYKKPLLLKRINSNEY